MRILIGILMLLALSDNAIAENRNNRIGQNQWCWVSAHGSTEFCDYSSYGSCREKNKGDGTCFRR